MPQGSRPGERRGGRRKGTPNKATVVRQLQAQAGLAAAKSTGVLPLDIILTVAAGGPAASKISDRQLQAAIAAAPYMHPRLTAVAVKDVAPPDPVVEERRRAVRAALFAELDKLAQPAPLTIEAGSLPATAPAANRMVTGPQAPTTWE